MAELLKDDYKDDILNADTNIQRKYQMIQNEDDTISLVDVTEYLQVGDTFGSYDINATNKAVNKIRSINETNITEGQTKVGNAQSLRLSRSGNVVMISKTGNVNVSQSGDYQLDVSIPDGYRPSKDIHLPVFVFSGGSISLGRVRVFADGRVFYYIPSTGTREFQWYTTYITSDDIPEE